MFVFLSLNLARNEIVITKITTFPVEIFHAEAVTESPTK